MSVTLPRWATIHTPSSGERADGLPLAPRALLTLAAARAVLAGVALVAAPWLYREHLAGLVLLRPTKEVLLLAGFAVRREDLSLPAAVVAALPLLLAGVWLFYALGRAYSPRLEEAELPGLAGRILPKRRLDDLRDALERDGLRVVLLGRLAAFPSTLMAAAAGASGLSWRRFVVADTVGAIASLTICLTAGYVLGETYERAGPWLTAVGAVVLVVVAVVIGRSMSRGSGSS